MKDNVVRRYQEFFKILTTYHRQPVEQRPAFLRGFVLMSSQHNPDPFTREKVADFYAKESLRHAPKPASSG